MAITTMYTTTNLNGNCKFNLKPGMYIFSKKNKGRCVMTILNDSFARIYHGSRGGLICKDLTVTAAQKLLGISSEALDVLRREIEEAQYEWNSVLNGDRCDEENENGSFLSYECVVPCDADIGIVIPGLELRRIKKRIGWYRVYRQGGRCEAVYVSYGMYFLIRDAAWQYNEYAHKWGEVPLTLKELMGRLANDPDYNIEDEYWNDSDLM